MVLLTVIVVVTLGLLITQVVSLEVTALSVVAVLGLTGLLDADEVLSGFSSSATLTVAAMLILSAGLERAGVVDFVGRAIARRASGGTTKLLLLIAGPTVLFSAFMNNTAVVALMIPVCMITARRVDQPASKLLLPVSYLSILGGTCTLIGTSTNILVDSLYRRAGGPGFSMFEFSGLGLIYLVIGGIYVVVLIPRFLPDRTSLAKLMDDTETSRFVTEVSIPHGSSIVGQPLGTVFAGDDEILAMELFRGGEKIDLPDGEIELHAGDVLQLEGAAKSLYELIDHRRVVTSVAAAESDPDSRKSSMRMVEAVLASRSSLLGRRVRDLRLNRRLGIRVLAVRRLGRAQTGSFRDLRLRTGDVLLLQGNEEALSGLQDEGEVLLVQGIEKTLTFPRKAPLALGILGLVVGLAAFEVAPLVLLAFAGVGLMLITGCLTLSNATRALDAGVLLLLAGMIPLGLAMEKTGLATVIADAVVDFAGPRGPLVLIGAFYLLTSLLTEVLSNNAAAVLLTPICLGTAAQLGIDPKPLLVALTFGASASFATPIGYQTNTMVMAPGGYLFRDYLRVGLPMNLAMAALATFLIPMFWPP